VVKVKTLALAERAVAFFGAHFTVSHEVELLAGDGRQALGWLLLVGQGPEYVGFRAGCLCENLPTDGMTALLLGVHQRETLNLGSRSVREASESCEVTLATTAGNKVFGLVVGLGTIGTFFALGLVSGGTETADVCFDDLTVFQTLHGVLESGKDTSLDVGDPRQFVLGGADEVDLAIVEGEAEDLGLEFGLFGEGCFGGGAIKLDVRQLEAILALRDHRNDHVALESDLSRVVLLTAVSCRELNLGLRLVLVLVCAVGVISEAVA
jgi:hypothetical protein